MITVHNFTKDWLLSVNNKLCWSRQEDQLKNLEKAIAALYLLELLADTNLKFIFKGGTSLFLLLKNIYRLSVDIDIIVDDPSADANRIFEQVCSDSKLFTHFVYEERDRRTFLEVKHYKFFYQPFADSVENSYIILDWYESANPYSKILELELVSEILDTQGENKFVRVPDIDSILGDKLTAFAPDTIGISLSAEPGHRPKRIEVLKQLFDIGNLYNVAENVENIRSSYTKIAKQEIKGHELNITAEDTLRDSLRHAYIIGHKGKIDKLDYMSIAKGFNDFRKFVVDLRFDENHAILAAAKTAYLVSVLLSGGNDIEKYDERIDMEHWVIKDEAFRDFNDYKYSNPEAFFYWHKGIAMFNPNI